MSDSLHQPHHPKTFIDIGSVDIVDAAQKASAPKPEQAVPSFEKLPAFVGSEKLTPAEKRVLACLVEGIKAKFVGQALKISHRTVEDHQRGILKKMRPYIGSTKSKNPVILLALHVHGITKPPH